MIPAWQLITVSAVYIAILFSVAWYGDRRARAGRPIHNSALVYSLSLAVYCSSWTFYGATGQATTHGWQFIALYIAPPLFIFLFWRLYSKIVRIAKEKRLTSIADFIATRYGRDHSLAILVTLVSTIGVLPYLALQLKAIAMSFELMIDHDLMLQGTLSIWHDTAFYICLIMTLFVILFGTRSVDASEQHPGMLLAVAFESLVKLAAIGAIGLWIVYGLFDSPSDVLNSARIKASEHALLDKDIVAVSFLAQLLLAAFAFLCLPRQFQVGVIENTSVQHVKTARWIFPLYMVLILAGTIPISLAGYMYLNEFNLPHDTYVLSLPLHLNQHALATIAFIGGASAATGMIIVAAIAISTMISNELILPMLFRNQERQTNGNIRSLVLMVRRLTIAAIMLGSYMFYRLVEHIESLASIGLLSFAVVVQFIPAMIGGMYWQGGNRQGAIAGILGGTTVWVLTLLIPTLSQQLDPTSPTSFSFWQLNIDDFTVSSLLSLLINIALYVIFSNFTTTSVRERMLASDFISTKGLKPHPDFIAPSYQCKVDDVRVVLERVLGSRKTEKFFLAFQQQHGPQNDLSLASSQLLHDAEELLASVVGSSSAHVIFSTLLGGEQIQVRDLAFIASEASQAFSMSREQLQAALENLQQGVSVIDKNLNLVAWNRRYLELLNYPADYVYVGRPVADLIALNAKRGYCGLGSIDYQVNRRMTFLRSGSPHQFERQLPDGTVLYMQGHPMPDGGFVTSFTDITMHRKAEQTLKEANITLEQRVEANTQELDDLTSRLIEANQSKTRFLAAAGHDLMQPLNAAKLFASTLAQHALNDEQRKLLAHLEGSLQSAEDVLSVLVEISKLDAQAMEPSPHPISLNSVLKPLNDEFTALAAEKGLTLRFHHQDYWVLSDAHWLRRIIQNLLSNAVRYTEQGSILLGCRKRGDELMIEVWDTGRGIPKSKLSEIFHEFKRLSASQNETKGLGLGLAIVDRMAKRLGHRIEVDSWLGHGSRFRLYVPMTEGKIEAPRSLDNVQRSAGSFAGLNVFCIDNDATVLEGMKALLGSWQCNVYSCNDFASALQVPFTPDILLADYQLDNEETGIQVMQALREQFGSELPGILISADPRAEVEEEARHLNYYFLKKPLRPAALRALMRRLT